MPLTVLTASPFNLVLGNSIIVTIVANNYYGASVVSENGSGANIILVADAPINLVNVPAITTA